jgi:hypothetical protein
MKTLYYFTTLLLLPAVFIIVGCGKTTGYNEIVSADKTPPDPVSNIQIQNDAGTATLTYTLPESENILYVEASYEIRPGVKRQSVSSYYSNRVVLDGFAKDIAYNVQVVTVSRANVRSQPVNVQVHPSRPPYLTAMDNILIRSTFGGVNAVLKNPTKANVGVAILKYDSTYRVMKPVTQKFGKDSSLSALVRGYDSVNYYWGFVTMDQFGNRSDTVFQWIKPIFEIQLPKYPTMKGYALSTDATPGWTIDNLVNNTFAINSDAANCWRGTGQTAYPISCTIDLGGLRKLSRYLLYGRNGSTNQFMWTNENPVEWTMWGCSDIIPDNVLLPTGAQLGDQVGNWLCLGRFLHPPKPSGLPVNQSTQADIDLYNAGFPYDFDLNIPNLRYIRFSCEQNFDGTFLCIVREITFFGQVQ